MDCNDGTKVLSYLKQNFSLFLVILNRHWVVNITRIVNLIMVTSFF
jgi:hypothetical protein